MHGFFLLFLAVHRGLFGEGGESGLVATSGLLAIRLAESIHVREQVIRLALIAVPIRISFFIAKTVPAALVIDIVLVFNGVFVAVAVEVLFLGVVNRCGGASDSGSRLSLHCVLRRLIAVHDLPHLVHAHRCVNVGILVLEPRVSHGIVVGVYDGLWVADSFAYAPGLPVGCLLLDVAAHNAVVGHCAGGVEAEHCFRCGAAAEPFLAREHGLVPTVEGHVFANGAHLPVGLVEVNRLVYFRLVIIGLLFASATSFTIVPGTLVGSSKMHYEASFALASVLPVERALLGIGWDRTASMLNNQLLQLLDVRVFHL